MKWIASESISQEKEKKKNVMIYHASPEPHTRGYFVSTSRFVRDEYLRKMNGDDI